MQCDVPTMGDLAPEFVFIIESRYARHPTVRLYRIGREVNQIMPCCRRSAVRPASACCARRVFEPPATAALVPPFALSRASQPCAQPRAVDPRSLSSRPRVAAGKRSGCGSRLPSSCSRWQVS